VSSAAPTARAERAPGGPRSLIEREYAQSLPIPVSALDIGVLIEDRLDVRIVGFEVLRCCHVVVDEVIIDDLVVFDRFVLR